MGDVRSCLPANGTSSIPVFAAIIQEETVTSAKKSVEKVGTVDCDGKVPIILNCRMFKNA